MSDIKPIYHLPELQDGQEWSCEFGCTVHKPKLYENVYSQSWDIEGNLIDEKSEHYYTCRANHLLFVSDDAGDVVELDPKHYTES